MSEIYQTDLPKAASKTGVLKRPKSFFSREKTYISGPSAGSVIGDIIKNEGFGAFFKGSVPKVLTVGPKLVFSFTIAQYLMQLFEGSSSVKVSVPSPRATPTPAAA